MKVMDGDLVLLVGNRRLLVRVPEKLRSRDLVLDSSALIDLDYGSIISIGSNRYRIISPLLEDLLLAFKRGPQVVLPKDAAQIVRLASLGPGSRVVEGGTGSGYLTLFLAWHVRPGGIVITYDKRREFSELAKKNLKRVGMDHLVDFRIGDVAEADVKNADALVLDIPNPWDVMETGVRILRVGGTFISYVPTTTQVERLLRCFDDHYLVEGAMEVMVRDWTLSRGFEGLRPSFGGPAHTGFIVWARRI